MAKIHVVIADSDELYLDRMSRYLINKSDSCEVSVFTSTDILKRYLCESTHKVDILIIPSDFANEDFTSFGVPVNIILSDETECNKIDGYEYINKYQKASTFVNDILMIYAEKMGKPGVIAKSNNITKIIGVYSPIGGSGKTTIALGLGTICSNAGLKVLYLNMERTDSSKAFFNSNTKGSISDVFFSLKSKTSNVGLRILANVNIDPNTKLNYMNSPDSALEFDEITEVEISRLLSEIEALKEYNLVIVDMHSILDKKNIGVMSLCDMVIIPVCQDPLAISKFEAFSKEFSHHDSLNSLIPKIHVVINKVNNNANLNMQLGVVTKYNPVEVSILYSPVLADVKNLAYASNLNQSGLGSIAKKIIEL